MEYNILWKVKTIEKDILSEVSFPPINLWFHYLPSFLLFVKLSRYIYVLFPPLLFLHKTQHTVYACYTHQLNPDWRKLFPKSFPKHYLIPKPDKDIKKKNKKSHILCEHRYKYFKQNISQPNLQYIKEILHHDRVEFILEIQAASIFEKLINIIHHSLGGKKKKNYDNLNRYKKKYLTNLTPILVNFLKIINLACTY